MQCECPKNMSYDKKNKNNILFSKKKIINSIKKKSNKTSLKIKSHHHIKIKSHKNQTTSPKSNNIIKYKQTFAFHPSAATHLFFFFKKKKKQKIPQIKMFKNGKINLN